MSVLVQSLSSDFRLLAESLAIMFTPGAEAAQQEALEAAAVLSYI